MSFSHLYSRNRGLKHFFFCLKKLQLLIGVCEGVFLKTNYVLGMMHTVSKLYKSNIRYQRDRGKINLLLCHSLCQICNFDSMCFLITLPIPTTCSNEERTTSQWRWYSSNWDPICKFSHWTIFFFCCFFNHFLQILLLQLLSFSWEISLLMSFSKITINRNEICIQNFTNFTVK